MKLSLYFQVLHDYWNPELKKNDLQLSLNKMQFVPSFLRVTGVTWPEHVHEIHPLQSSECMRLSSVDVLSCWEVRELRVERAKSCQCKKFVRERQSVLYFRASYELVCVGEATSAELAVFPPVKITGLKAAEVILVYSGLLNYFCSYIWCWP